MSMPMERGKNEASCTSLKKSRKGWSADELVLAAVIDNDCHAFPTAPDE